MTTTHHLRNKHGQRFQLRKARNTDDLYFNPANTDTDSKLSLESIAKSCLDDEGTQADSNKSGGGGRRGLMSRGLKVLLLVRRSERHGIKRERNKLRKRER